MTTRPQISGLLTLLLVVSTTSPVSAARIVLREQATLSGSVVLLGDIAEITGETAAEAHHLATTPLMAAPAFGTQEFLHVSKVLELLESRGVDTSDIIFAGARTVEVGETMQVANPIVNEPVRSLAPAELEQAATDAILSYLENVSGHQDWQVEVSLSAASLRDLGKFGSEMVASAGKSPWTGTQKFQIAGIDEAKSVMIVAKVTRLRNVVVATRRIEQGSLVGAADVELRLEGHNVPTTAAQSLDLVVGREAVRSIDANAIIQESQTRSPLQVQRGEIVKVFARTGGITVSTFAVVQQNGALGDLVQVQTLDKKERFAARVSGWKQLEVLPTGATTADYAALNKPETQQR